MSEWEILHYKGGYDFGHYLVGKTGDDDIFISADDCLGPYENLKEAAAECIRQEWIDEVEDRLHEVEAE